MTPVVLERMKDYAAKLKRAADWDGDDPEDMPGLPYVHPRDLSNDIFILLSHIERLEKVFVYTHLDECEKRINAASDWYFANRHATAAQRKAFEQSWRPENDRMFADADKLYQEIKSR